jgi:ribosomal 50S subunit-recycling heat shock protein
MDTLLCSSAPLLLRSSASLLLCISLLFIMRLDLFLKHSRLVTRRTLAQELCEAGAVKINGTSAKSSRDVREGDLLTIRRAGRMTTFRVLRVPERPPSKSQAPSLYETLGVESYEID